MNAEISRFRAFLQAFFRYFPFAKIWLSLTENFVKTARIFTQKYVFLIVRSSPYKRQKGLQSRPLSEQ